MSRAPTRQTSRTTSAPPPAAPAQVPADGPARMVELRVSANLMLLEAGLYCLYQQPGQMPAPQDGTGLPGVRISLPPNVALGTDAITIRGLHPDGWLGPRDGAALVQVRVPAAQVLVTVYQSPAHPAETAPRLKVVRLEPEPIADAQPPAAQASASRSQRQPAAAQLAAKPAAEPDVVAHVQRAGDLGVAFGEWLGIKGSQQWVEGFGLSARPGMNAEDIEYQAVLGRGWLSPWVSAGKFCGSRGMALPLLGFNLRLRGKLAEQYDCTYSATFTDGTEVGPIPAGRSCEAPSLAPLEALCINLHPRAKPAATPARKPAPSRKR